MEKHSSHGILWTSEWSSMTPDLLQICCSSLHHFVFTAVNRMSDRQYNSKAVIPDSFWTCFNAALCPYFLLQNQSLGFYSLKRLVFPSPNTQVQIFHLLLKGLCPLSLSRWLSLSETHLSEILRAPHTHCFNSFSFREFSSLQILSLWCSLPKFFTSICPHTIPVHVLRPILWWFCIIILWSAGTPFQVKG